MQFGATSPTTPWRNLRGFQEACRGCYDNAVTLKVAVHIQIFYFLTWAMFAGLGEIGLDAPVPFGSGEGRYRFHNRSVGSQSSD